MRTVQALLRRFGFSGGLLAQGLRTGFAEQAPGRVPLEDDCFARLANGLVALLARQPGGRARKVLPHTFALVAALRVHDRYADMAVPAELLLDSMHECWSHLDPATQDAFKACLRALRGHPEQGG